MANFDATLTTVPNDLLSYNNCLQGMSEHDLKVILATMLYKLSSGYGTDSADTILSNAACWLGLTKHQQLEALVQTLFAYAIVVDSRTSGQIEDYTEPACLNGLDGETLDRLIVKLFYDFFNNKTMV